MEFALGVLGWSAEEFWDATHLEYTSAWVGHCRRHGLGPWSNSGMSEAEKEDFRAAVKEIRRRYKPGSTRAGMTKAMKRAYKIAAKHGGGVIRG